MIRKVLSLLFAISLIVSLFIGCNDEGTEISSDESTGVSESNDTEEDSGSLDKTLTLTSMSGPRTDESGKDKKSRLEEYIEEKFNVKFDAVYFSGAAYEDKMTLVLASGNYPDILWTTGGSGFAETFIESGLGVDFTPYLDKIPNYRALYNDDQWSLMIKNITNLSDDKKLYILPYTETVEVNFGEHYDKTFFDQEGLKPPVTADDLYDILVYLKNKNPDSYPLAPRRRHWEISKLAFSIFRTDKGYYIDYDTNELVFGPVTNSYRKALIYLNRLYKEGLLDPEFSTPNGAQWLEETKRDLHPIRWGYSIVQSLLNEGGQWYYGHTWERLPTGLIKESANSKEGTAEFYDKHVKAGAAITDKASQEVIDRFIKIIDWSCSEEGIIKTQFGFEGETYEMVNGKPVFKDFIKTLKNPEGKSILEYGTAGYLASKTANYYEQLNGPVVIQNSEQLKTLDRLPQNLTEDYSVLSEKMSSSIKQNVEDKFLIMFDLEEENYMKFVMGELDPNSEDDWNAHIAAFEKAGMEYVTTVKEQVIVK